MSLLEKVQQTKTNEAQQTDITDMYDQSGRNVDYIVMLPMNEIDPYKDEFGESQPFTIDSSELDSLILSIKDSGLEEAIKVKQTSPHKYMILGGHRRFEACRRLGFSKVPAVIVDVKKEDEFDFVCNNNVHRKNTPPSTFAKILAGYRKRGKSIDNIVSIYGLNRRTYYRYIHMANCIENLQVLGDQKMIRLEAFEILSKLNQSEQQQVADFLLLCDYKITIDKKKAQGILSLKNIGKEITCSEIYNFFYAEQNQTNLDTNSILLKSKSEINEMCDSGMFNSIIKGYCLKVFDDLGLSDRLVGYSFSRLFDYMSAEEARQKSEE